MHTYTKNLLRLTWLLGDRRVDEKEEGHNETRQNDIANIPDHTFFSMAHKQDKLS